MTVEDETFDQLIALLQWIRYLYSLKCCIINNCYIFITEQGFSLDFVVATVQVRALYSPPTPGDVIFTFRVDAIAQEPNETLTLALAPIGILPPSTDGSFFLDTLSLTIIDSDSKCDNN